MLEAQIKLTLFDDAQCVIARQLACPADDEFLRILVEIAVAERIGVERLEQLRHFLHSQFDHRNFGRFARCSSPTDSRVIPYPD